VGSTAEVILFLGGYFMGKKMFLTAITFLAIRIASKAVVSSLIYKRGIMIIRENTPRNES
jgi:hypothetical protein